MRFVAHNPAIWALVGVLLVAVLVPTAILVFLMPQTLENILRLPWYVRTAGMGFIFAAIFMAALWNAVYRVELGEAEVRIFGPLRRRTLRRGDTQRVTVEPPVTTPKLDISFWGEVDSKCTVYLRDGQGILLAMMSNGLKFRIAGILDPTGHPEAAAFVAQCFSDVRERVHIPDAG